MKWSENKQASEQESTAKQASVKYNEFQLKQKNVCVLNIIRFSLLLLIRIITEWINEKFWSINQSINNSVNI